MTLHYEIAKVVYELYEKSGRIEGIYDIQGIISF